MQCRSETYKQTNVYQMHLVHAHKHVQAHSLCMTNAHVVQYMQLFLHVVLLLRFLLLLLLYFFYSVILGGWYFFFPLDIVAYSVRVLTFVNRPIITLQNAYIF